MHLSANIHFPSAHFPVSTHQDLHNMPKKETVALKQTVQDKPEFSENVGFLQLFFGWFGSLCKGFLFIAHLNLLLQLTLLVVVVCVHVSSVYPVPSDAAAAAPQTLKKWQMMAKSCRRRRPSSSSTTSASKTTKTKTNWEDQITANRRDEEEAAAETKVYNGSSSC